MFLNKIIYSKKRELEVSKARNHLKKLKKKIADLPPTKGFLEAIKKESSNVKLIAEIKKASPSKGVIREDFNPKKIAILYELAGAKAISVLTETEYFQGHPDYLKEVRNVVNLPLLRKDFIIDEYQLYESRVLGADAVLLIAAALEENQLKEYLALAKELDLAVLTEIHSLPELEMVLTTDVEIIGINNRNLATFETDINITTLLSTVIPAEKVVVSESGIKTKKDIELLEKYPVDAILVGETFMRNPDIYSAVKSLMGGF